MSPRTLGGSLSMALEAGEDAVRRESLFSEQSSVMQLTLIDGTPRSASFSFCITGVRGISNAVFIVSGFGP